MKKPMIKMQKVKKSYQLEKMEVPVLHGIDLEVREGEFLAIMGPSGSGKSTLMNMIGFLDRPTSGEYYLDGVSVKNKTDNELAHIRNSKIGFVFQQFHLLARTSAVDNVALPLMYAGTTKAERIDRAKQMLTEVGLGEKFANKPNELSGGQQQRVSIARALVNNPSIVLADEPTGALDSKTTKEIMEILKKIHKQGRTIIIITHELSVAKQAERIVYIRDGLLYHK